MLKIYCYILFVLIPILLAGQSVSVSVTNNNIALVKETRHIDLKKGENIIEIIDLPALLEPTSVFINVTDQNFHVLEQNFEYDLLNAGKILNKAIGTNIRLVNPDGVTLTGRLLHAGTTDIVLETANNELQVVPRRQNYQIVVEEFGKNNMGWVTKPTLKWLLDATSNEPVDTEVSYLTRGLNWHAEYIANLDENDQFADIAAWVSIENTSGKTYQNAQLKLIAGDMHLVKRRRNQPQMMANAYDYAEKKQFSEKELFEYYLYTLERKTTIKNNQIKQIELFPTSKTKINKIFRYNYYKNSKNVSVLVSIINSEENGLGIPLPKGSVRIYKNDGKDQQFIGEDQIDHTARDEKIELEVGNAFDIAATRIVKEKRQLSKNSEKEKIAIEIRNHKKESISVSVVEFILPHRRNYELLNSDFPVTRKDASQIEFVLPVPANSSKTITFEILFSW